VDIDPFGRANPIGPGAALSVYKAGANAAGTGLTYAALVRTQANLDVSGIDAGLAVLISAQQAQLKRQAADYVDTVVADFFTLATDVGNFSDLWATFASDQAVLSQLANGPIDSAVREQLTAVANYAGEIGADGDTAIDHAEVVQTALDKVGQRLNAALDRAISSAGEQAVAAAERIDKLNTKIADSIQAIVDGANETGDAVTNLGIGILTEITKHTGGGDLPDVPDDDPDEDLEGFTPSPSNSDEDFADPDEDFNAGTPLVPIGADADREDKAAERDSSTSNKSDGKVPDVSFVVSAIRAGSKGTEKYAAAMASLQRSNDQLAAQYQRLAAIDQLIAVAKATQAQQSLFTDSVTETVETIKTIRDGWSTLRGALIDWSRKTSAEDAADLGQLMPGALKQWQAVATDLTKMKRALTSVGTLPAS
jgi:hypothetical protein